METISSDTQADKREIRKAVILLSGGIDSTVALYKAIDRGFVPCCLTINYDQRNQLEITKAETIARSARAEWKLVYVGMSSFLISEMLQTGTGNLERNRSLEEIDDKNIKTASYIPARNMIFISLAVSYAEQVGARDIFIGVYNDAPYPDATAKFVNAMEKASQKATFMGRFGHKMKIHTFGRSTKLDVLEYGVSVGADLANTTSCYAPVDGMPCGVCDACVLRREAFRYIGFDDPALLGVANG